MAEKQNTPEIRFEGFTDPWEQRKWSEYVSISTDMVDPRSGNYGNLPHVGPGNMESFTGRLYDNVNTVKDDALISGKFHFNPGDIIYGKINPQLGKYTYAQFEGLASADAYVLNGKNGLTQEFLFGILQTKAFFDYSVSVSMRSGMPKINRDELNAFEFLAPNESEQRAIGDILLKLDDLITLHQRKHDKLCTVKKSMLDKMFPKPGETEPEIRFKGFTDPWEQRKLGELLLFQNGFNGSSESFGSGIPLISVMDVLDDEFITHETVRGKARLNYEEASRYCVEYGDVLFQRSSENQEDAGTSNVYLDQHVPSAFGGFVIRGKKVDEYNPIFIKYLLGSSFIREQITHRAQGAQHINVSQDTLAGVVLLMPSMREQEAVGLVFLHLANLITLHQRKLDLLKNTKKSLLDKMFV